MMAIHGCAVVVFVFFNLFLLKESMTHRAADEGADALHRALRVGTVQPAESAQPARSVKVPLWDHQLSCVRRMAQLESGTEPGENIVCVLGGRRSSGKTMVVLARIADDPWVVAATEGSRTPLPNLIVCPAPLVAQWAEHVCSVTGLTQCSVCRRKDVPSALSGRHAIVVCASSMFRALADAHAGGTRHADPFARVVFDEADNIIVPACPEVPAHRTWLVSATVRPLLLPQGWHRCATTGRRVAHARLPHYGFIRNACHRLSPVAVTDPSRVLVLPNPNTDQPPNPPPAARRTVVRCCAYRRPTACDVAYLPAHTVHRRADAGSLPELLALGRVSEAAARVAREQCPICLLDLSPPLVVMQTCGHGVCYGCLTDQLRSPHPARLRCPMCRGPIEPMHIVAVGGGTAAGGAGAVVRLRGPAAACTDSGNGMLDGPRRALAGPRGALRLLPGPS